MEELQTKTKFCKFCAEKIAEDAVICTYCGRQVENIKSEQPQIIVNNSNVNTNTNKNLGGYCKEKNKWIALLLCVFLGCFGAHKFYEEKNWNWNILLIYNGGIWDRLDNRHYCTYI